MTRLEALKYLLAKVEAGDLPFPALNEIFPRRGATIELVAKAYHGSLDAAKALHEAVLPGWAFSLAVGKRANGEMGCGAFLVHDELEGIDGEADTPARAWLIAILKALIAKEEG